MSREKSKKQSKNSSSKASKRTSPSTEDSPWSSRELKFVRSLDRPYKVQEFLDEIPYRCEDEFPPPTRVLRDLKAHCYDGAMFAAAALRKAAYRVALVNLRAERDDDHLLCVYRVGRFFGSVAKSNFPSLRSREPVYASLRELVMTYFDFYCNLDREKTLRGYSHPLDLSGARNGTEWEWSLAAVDELGDRLVARRHFPLLTVSQDRSLRLIDRRLFESQLVGVNMRGAYGSSKK